VRIAKRCGDAPPARRIEPEIFLLTLIMRLPDGRKLGCLQVGRADGFPVFHFHGNGSSRFEILLLADLADAAGARLIGLDRPGIGDSDPAPGHGLAHWPADVVAVADQLALDRFAIQGVSAGGAYALVCAQAIGDRLTGCALVSTICPPELIRQAAPGWMRAVWWAGNHHPELLHRGLRALMPDCPPDEPNTEQRLLRIGAWLSATDQEVLRRPLIRAALVRAMMESRRQGAAANRQEILALMRSWNLSLGQLALRNVSLWHGGLDRLTPIGPARLLARTLPHCTATFYPGEGHFSTFANHAREVLRALCV
jgi:pimeloyl-ACP methyl ester carboxylesterase